MISQGRVSDGGNGGSAAARVENLVSFVQCSLILCHCSELIVFSLSSKFSLPWSPSLARRQGQAGVLCGAVLCWGVCVPPELRPGDLAALWPPCYIFFSHSTSECCFYHLFSLVNSTLKVYDVETFNAMPYFMYFSQHYSDMLCYG